MIYVILGPTGSGKTKYASKLFFKLNNPLIVNADAFQVYQDMNIGTAKIKTSDPLYKNYVLLDILAPNKTFSIQEYQIMFRSVVDNAIKEGRDIIVVGGSGLYVKAALYDYQFITYDNEIDMQEYESLSNDELFEILKNIDEKEAQKLHPNNRKRVLQAIKIAKIGSGSKSELIDKQEHKIIYDNVKFLYINHSRDELYERINLRVDEMIDEGLVDEVKQLLDKYDLSLTAYQAIGYKEIIDYLNGKYDLASAIELIKKRTRNYAKRQVTFFKHQFDSSLYVDIEQFINSL